MTEHSTYRRRSYLREKWENPTVRQTAKDVAIVFGGNYALKKMRSPTFKARAANVFRNRVAPWVPGPLRRGAKSIATKFQQAGFPGEVGHKGGSKVLVNAERKFTRAGEILGQLHNATHQVDKATRKLERAGSRQAAFSRAAQGGKSIVSREMLRNPKVLKQMRSNFMKTPKGDREAVRLAIRSMARAARAVGTKLV